MKCLMCPVEGDPSTNPGSFILSGWGWLCSMDCYAKFCRNREQQTAKEIYGEKAIVRDTK
jgi:hypothetical protein